MGPTPRCQILEFAGIFQAFFWHFPGIFLGIFQAFSEHFQAFSAGTFPGLFLAFSGHFSGIFLAFSRPFFGHFPGIFQAFFGHFQAFFWHFSGIFSFDPLGLGPFQDKITQRRNHKLLGTSDLPYAYQKCGSAHTDNFVTTIREASWASGVG